MEDELAATGDVPVEPLPADGVRRMPHLVKEFCGGVLAYGALLIAADADGGLRLCERPLIGGFRRVVGRVDAKLRRKRFGIAAVIPPAALCGGKGGVKRGFIRKAGRVQPGAQPLRPADVPPV